MTEQDAERIAREWIDAWNRHNLYHQSVNGLQAAEVISLNSEGLMSTIMAHDQSLPGSPLA